MEIIACKLVKASDGTLTAYTKAPEDDNWQQIPDDDEE